MLVNNLILITIAASDALSWDIARQIIQTQEWLAFYGITIVIALAGILIFITWFANVLIHKREITKAIAEIRKEHDIEYTKLYEKTDARMIEIKKDLQEKIIKSLNRILAESERAFALLCDPLHKPLLDSCIGHWALAVIYYKKADNEEYLRISVDALRESLIRFEGEALSAKNRGCVEKCLPYIPSILSQEKEAIEDRLNQLK